jgi:hypothetical protein
MLYKNYFLFKWSRKNINNTIPYKGTSDIIKGANFYPMRDGVLVIGDNSMDLKGLYNGNPVSI